MTDDRQPAIEARGLYHIYRETEAETVALRGTGVALWPGEWTSVMGPSGSGKSTLLQIMGGLLEPSGGAVVIDGRDITRMPPRERARWRRRRIGIVLQRENLHPLLSVGDNVALPLRIDGRSRREIDARVAELLGSVGLIGHLRARAARLSGGEAQRVALAVALAVQPQVLLADEPTGELDEQTSVAVLDLLDAARASGAALLTVTHNRRVAERADHRLSMRDGLVGDGD